MSVPQLAGLTLMEFAAAAAGAYENIPPTWTSPRMDVHSFLNAIGGADCIAQEGTQDFDEWIRDFDALPVEVPGMPELGPVHQGIRDTVLEVFSQISAWLESKGWPQFVLTGHSKGAGEACLMGGMFKAIGHPPAAVAAFEPPMVGGPMLRALYADIPNVVTRTQNIHGPDIVTEARELFPLACHISEPLILTVPDSFDIATKHRIPAVLSAVARL